MKCLVSLLLAIAVAIGVYVVKPAELAESKRNTSTQPTIESTSSNIEETKHQARLNQPITENEVSKVRKEIDDVTSEAAQQNASGQVSVEGYTLLAPQESIAIFEEHLNAEFCLGYADLIDRYGSLEDAAIERENLYEDPIEETMDLYRDVGERCASYEALSLEDFHKEIDDLLIEAIELGSEVAEFKYGTNLFQRSLFGKGYYTEQQRKEQVTEAIQIFEKYVEKGHFGSMGSMAMILLDGINYPDTYDLDRGNYFMSKLREVDPK